jgi:hypothetical protein
LGSSYLSGQGGPSNGLEQQNDEHLSALHSKLKALHQVSAVLDGRSISNPYCQQTCLPMRTGDD